MTILAFLCISVLRHARTVMVCNVGFFQVFLVAELIKENARDLFSHLSVSQNEYNLCHSPGCGNGESYFSG